MRTQAGSTSLRTLLYMDEIFGYLPPTANPPSKTPLLRMLKQARAFGVGLVLATQNPVDVDYKGLSNAGTWFIGKLQTDQDKQRLLDGLEGAASGGLDRGEMDKLISSLGKRVFIMQNVHAPKPVTFQTRWTMNFLAGPLTRAQIPALNTLVGAAGPSSGPLPRTAVQAGQATSQPVVSGNTSSIPPVTSTAPSSIPFNAASSQQVSAGSVTRPAVPSGIPEYFLPMNQSFTKALAAAGQNLQADTPMAGISYHPTILASAQVRFLDRRYNLDSQQVRSTIVTTLDKRGVVKWDDFIRNVPDEKSMDPAPDPQGRFLGLDAPISDAKLLTALQKDFTDWSYRTSKLTIRSNPSLGVNATPEVSQAEFMKACTDAARQTHDDELAKSTAKIDRQIDTLKEKLAKEQRELQQDQTEVKGRMSEELVNGAETLLSFLGGRRSRRISTTLSKHRMTAQAKADVNESTQTIADLTKQLAELEQTRQQVMDETTKKWGDSVNEITEITVTPKKTDVYVNMFGVAWMPYYQFKSGNQVVEIPAYQ